MHRKAKIGWQIGGQNMLRRKKLSNDVVYKTNVKKNFSSVVRVYWLRLRFQGSEKAVVHCLFCKLVNFEIFGYTVASWYRLVELLPSCIAFYVFRTQGNVYKY